MFLRKIKYVVIITVLNCLKPYLCYAEVLNEDLLHRSRRQLLFPNSTLLQLNIGVATPTPIDTVKVNWAFQANFQLPWNRSQIPVDILHANNGYVTEARRKREVEGSTSEIDSNYESDAGLYHFYKYVEDVLNGDNWKLQNLYQESWNSIVFILFTSSASDDIKEKFRNMKLLPISA